MLSILHRRVQFDLGERADTAFAATPNVPIASLPLAAARAATPAFPEAASGSVPAHWGQAHRQIPNINLQEPYRSDEPARRAAPAVQQAYRDYVDPRDTLMGSSWAPYWERQAMQGGYPPPARTRTPSPMAP
eukprot:16208595-Heterocapsa_arctica.AAC.1